jgi:hypothetical protein
MNIPAGHMQLAKSERRPAPGARRVDAADPSENLTVSVRVRRRPDAPPLPRPGQGAAAPNGPKYLSREKFAATYGAAPEDLQRVADFARKSGLRVVESDAARRTVVLAGTVDQFSRAFAVELGVYETPEETYRGREGFIHLPQDLVPIVEGVFGLDNRRMARSHLQRSAAGAAAAIAPLTPPQVAGLYRFPPAPPGIAAQTIGLLEFGGGYLTSDIQAFFNGLGLPTPTLVSVGVDGATNDPGGEGSDEVTLDIDVAGSVAPGAKIAVYFAPWTEQGWVDVVTKAVYDTANAPSVLSISWGWAEFQSILGLLWSAAAMDAVSQTFAEAAAMGVTVLVASGDSGSYCYIGDSKAHVIYPASDPGVTTCGGTTIENISGSAFTEITWNDNGVTGGGISDHFPPPPWQQWAAVPPSVNDGHHGRGIPDVAGNADPDSGYVLILNGAATPAYGGTSAVAPLYAGLVAILNATLGEPVGYLNPNLYAFGNSLVYGDVNDGRSNAAAGAPGYVSGPGWDACTGFGSIRGDALLSALRGVGLPPALAHYERKLYMAWKGMERDDRIFWSTFNGTSWAPQQLVPSVGTSSGVALAVYGRRLFMAWKGTLGDERIFWSSFDGTTWSPQQVVPGVGTSTGPALAEFEGALYMAWKGIESDQRIFWTTYDGVSWNAQQVVDNVGTSVGPSLAVHRGDLFMAWKGVLGDERMFWSRFDGASWEPQQVIANAGSSEGPVLASHPFALTAAWKGMDGDQRIFWSRFEHGGWEPQQVTPGFGTSVGPSLAFYRGDLYMTWKGVFGDQRIFWSRFNGRVWTPQQVVPGVGTSPDLLAGG